MQDVFTMSYKTLEEVENGIQQIALEGYHIENVTAYFYRGEHNVIVVARLQEEAY